MNNKVIVELPSEEDKTAFKLILLMQGKSQRDVIVDFILKFNAEHRLLLAEARTKFSI